MIKKEIIDKLKAEIKRVENEIDLPREAQQYDVITFGKGTVTGLKLAIICVEELFINDL